MSPSLPLAAVAVVLSASTTPHDRPSPAERQAYAQRARGQFMSRYGKQVMAKRTKRKAQKAARKRNRR